jgi:IS5 family transposase
VEHLFGTLKRSYGYRRVRYVGLARNTTELWFKLLAYNLRRADRLVALAAAGP